MSLKVVPETELPSTPKPFGWAVQVNGLFAHIHREWQKEKIHRSASLHDKNLFSQRDNALAVCACARESEEGFQQIILLEIREDPEQPT